MPTILLKKSDTASAVPTTANLTNLAGGVEVAVNTADKRMFSMTSASAVIELGTNPSSLTCADASFTVARVGSLTISSLSLTNATFASATITNLTSTSATISSALTLSGGTANGVLYLNGSKVATSGSALTFDGSTLTNTGNSTGTIFNTIVNTDAAGSSISDERIVFAMGGSLGFGITGWANAGIVEAASTGGLYLGAFNGPINFASGASARNINMTLTASGNLGIGTTSPANALEIARGAGVAGGVSLRGNGNSAAAEFFVGQGSGSDAFLYNRANATMIFGTNNATRMTLTAAGDLGIGTTSPGRKLDVYGVGQFKDASGIGTTIWSEAITGGGGVGTNTNHPFALLTNGTERLRVDTSGNLGLGVTPSAFSTGKAMQIGALNGITLFGFAGGAEFGSNFNFDSSYKYTTTGASARYTTGGGTHAWYIAPSGTAGNAITFTQAMTLDASGNLIVGTTSAVGRFTLQDTGTTTEITLRSSGGVGNNNRARIIGGYESGGSDYGGYLAFNTTSSSNVNGERARITAGGSLLVGKTADNTTTLGAQITSGGIFNSAGTTDFWNSYSTSAAAYRFYVSNAGTIFATNTTISAISDQRFKENIRDLDVGLGAILALKPRKFDWKEGQGKDIKDDRGFIAQEFEQVFPDLVDEWKDSAPEGEEPYKSVRQDLIPVLVKAIQELKAELDATKAKVAQLEAR